MTGMRMINVFVGLGTTVLLAQAMGVREYGVYIFYLGLVYLLGLPLQMGMPTLVMRQVAIHRRRGETAYLLGIVRFGAAILAAGALLIVTIGGAAVLLFGSLGGALPEAASISLLAGSFGLLLLFGLLALLRAIIAGFEQVVAANIPEMLIRPVALFIFVAVLISDRKIDPGQAMLAHCLAAAVATIAGLFMAMREFSGLNRESVLAAYRMGSWLRSLWPLTLQSGGTLINNRLDIAMLGVLAGPTAVGLYDIATKLAGFINMGQGIVNALVSPRVAREYTGDNLDAVQRIMRHACRIAFVAAVILFVALLLAGPWIIPALFGEGFERAYQIALVAGIGLLFSTSVGAVGVLLNMTGNEKVVAQVLVASVFINGGLNLVAIPLYGALGAAMATTVTVVFVQYRLWLSARSLTSLRAAILA